MLASSTDDLDATIISLAARAYDLAERDLDIEENTAQLRAAVLAILGNLDARMRCPPREAAAVREASVV